MTSQRLLDLLDEFRDAVLDEDPVAAEQVLEEIEAEYDELTPDEERARARVLSARDERRLDPDDYAVLDELGRTLVSVSLTRSAVLTQGVLFVAAPSQVDVSEFADAISRSRTKEEEASELAEDAAAVLGTVSLPPVLVATTVTAPKREVPKGIDATFEIGIENAGNEEATEVTMAVTGDAPVTPSTVTVGALDPGDRVVESFVLDGDQAGKFEIEVRYEAAETDGGSRTIEVMVIDKVTAIERIRRDLERVQETAEQLGRRGRSVRSKLANARDALDRALEEARDGRAKQANNALNSAARMLGATLNEIEAGQDRGRGSGQGQPDDDGLDMLATTTEALIERIADAKDAQL